MAEPAMAGREPAGRQTAGLGIPVVWDEACLQHEPAWEVWLGVREPGTEVPARARVLLAALQATGALVVPATPHGDEVLRAVHEDGLIEHLRTLWDDWVAGGYVAQYGRDRAVPYVFPTAGLLAGLPLRSPAALHGRIGRFCYDTMTLVGPGSWAAIRGAVDAALTAVDLVTVGARAAYALCRPPGHHAGPSAHGGSCYLNNAAVAAEALRRAGARRVAVIDIDAHHGNGTQAVFYRRGDVYYGSLHVDPGAGWFPHYAGYSGERGEGPGQGANRNLPLAPGTGDGPWLAAVQQLCDEAAGADAVVVSLGVDAAAADPESPLEVTEAGYRAAGRLVGQLGPVVLIQEGGYDLATLGGLAVATLRGVADGLQLTGAAGAEPA
jgi:acetoin utilization deacetylase AcuC-like enzyme